MTTASSMFIVRTHDPVTGEAAVSADPPGDSRAEKVIAYLKELDPTDAVEAICRGSDAEMEIRPMPRTYAAEMKIAADLVRSGKITPKQALSRIRLDHFFALLRTSISNLAEMKEINRGLAAAPGAACGYVAFSAAKAVELKNEGKPAVLVVTKTSPDDMAALHAASAIVTFTGGFTSHSAVVARQLGKPCIVSAGPGVYPIDELVTIDGTKGIVYTGAPKFLAGELTEDMKVILEAADKSASLGVYANADTPEDFKTAFALGAQGVGLCRTEHTLFSEAGIAAIQQLILGKTPKATQLGVQMLQSFLHSHFSEVFAAARDAGGPVRPIVIRLLDPPLHEFLPHLDDAPALAIVAKRMKISVKVLKLQIAKLAESNPMLGHRGCRLAVTKPNLYARQVKAILNAAGTVSYKGPIGIMLPLITDVNELKFIMKPLKALVNDSYTYDNSNITFGAMLETPRACLMAYELAEFCDFFSFGTNDLTQMTWALSRDDSGTFLPAYAENNIMEDPFQSLDLDGVGKLMAYAIESLGERRAKVKIGICGEHGGDPRSIVFCHALGLDYVSCSPPRLTTARLAVGLSNVSAVDSFQIVKAPAPPPAANDLVAPKPVAVAEPEPKKTMPIPAPKFQVVPYDTPTLAVTVVSTLGVTSIPLATPPAAPPMKSMMEVLKDVKKASAQSPTADPDTPKWLVGALPATALDITTAPKSPIAKLAAALAGRKVKFVPSGTGIAPAWGVVVGHVSSPYMQLLVLAVGSGLGHDGKSLKAFIKYEIHIPPGTKLWFAQATEVAGMTA